MVNLLPTTPRHSFQTEGDDLETSAYDRIIRFRQWSLSLTLLTASRETRSGIASLC